MCLKVTVMPLLATLRPFPPTSRFPGYFSSKCCSTHCRESQGSGGGGGGGTESSGKDGRSAASGGLGCEFGGLVSLSGITKRILNWVWGGRNGTREHAHTGMPEERAEDRPSTMMHHA